MYFVCCQHRWQSVNTSDVLNVFEKSTIVCKHMGWLQLWVLRVPQTCIRSKAAQQVSLFTHYQKERLQPTVYLVQIKIKSNILFWQNPERKIGNEWVLSRNQLRAVSLKWSFNNEIYVSFPLRAHTRHMVLFDAGDAGKWVVSPLRLWCPRQGLTYDVV